MKNDAQKQFVTALNFLLQKEGHGAQAKLARSLNIDSGYLNNITKGRTPGPQEKKEKIASYFGLKYEEMLTLGRELSSLFSGSIIDNFKLQVKEAADLINNPKLQFHSAIVFLLSDVCSKFIKIIDKRYNIGLENLNSIKAGNACLVLSNDLKEQIAGEFGLTYQQVLSLGGWILSGKPPKEWSHYNKITCRAIVMPTYPMNKQVNEYSVQKQNCNYGTLQENTNNDDYSEYTNFHSIISHNIDRNMVLITEWINQQDDPNEFWIFLKILLKREYPEFNEWVKNQSSSSKKR